jgi:hypothetical protein
MRDAAAPSAEKLARRTMYGTALAAATGAMPMLEFMDSNGVTWRVWNTVPTSRTALTGAFERGWLTFESADGLKRLAPIPPQWDEAAPDRLELMCRAASEVPRRIRTADGPTEATPPAEGS